MVTGAAGTNGASAASASVNTGEALCCQLAALVAIDGRGQIVLPKELRDKAGLQAGDKLAVIAFQSEDDVFCMSLVKTEVFLDTVKRMLGPPMTEILGG